VSEDVIETIRAELWRLKATVSDVGPMDAITVSDRNHGNAVLSGSFRLARLWPPLPASY
jgi:hypothetical protein